MPTKIQDPLEPFFRHGNKVLRDRIFSEDVVLRDKLISIWIAANEKLLSFVKGNRKQDIQHSLTVENNIGLILERFNLLEKMKAKDLFILSVSAAIHDIWKAMYSHDTMEKHGEKGKGTLLKEGIRLELQIDRRYVEAIANIISVHDTGDIDKLSSDPFLIGERPGVLLRGLAAIFRLADMLDTTYERYPDLIDKLYTGYQKKGMNTATRFVGGWDFSADNKNIVLQIISPHTKRQKLCVMALIDAMNADLAKSRSSLENCKIITNSGDIVTASLPTSFVLMNQEMKKEPTGLKEFYKTLLESYLRSLHKSERYVDLGGLGVFGERARPLLSKVYIRLKAQRCSGYPLPGPIAEYNRVILDYKKKADKWSAGKETPTSRFAIRQYNQFLAI